MKRWGLSCTILVASVACAMWLQSTFPQAKEAILTTLGAAIALGGTWFFKSGDNEKSARYLAIRLVCLFDKYVEDCVSVVCDDGLRYGSRTEEGWLEPQVASPGQPIYPDDIDWKSISHDLMYDILSFSSEVEAGDSSISFSWDISHPPDYDEFFEDRVFQYAQFGLRAYELGQKLREEYGINKKDYGDWDPISVLRKKLEEVKGRRARLAQFNEKMTEDVEKNVA